MHMNEKTGTSVSFEKEKVKESQSQSQNVTPSLDTPSGAGLGASHKLCKTVGQTSQNQVYTKIIIHTKT